MSSITRADFSQGKWEIIENGKWIVDRTTGRKFAHEKLEVIQRQAVIGLSYSLCWSSLLTALCMGARMVKICTCYHFWKDNDALSNQDYAQMGVENPPPLTRMQRLKDMGIDLTKCICGPFFCLMENGLICIAAIEPSQNHRKYVNSCDRLHYSERCFVICKFRPEYDLEPPPAPPQEQMEATPVKTETATPPSPHQQTAVAPLPPAPAKQDPPTKQQTNSYCVIA